MPKITIYSKLSCVQCKQSKKLLDNLGLEYNEILLESHPEALERVLDMGYKSAPVIVTTDGDIVNHWAGFRPDNINSIGR